MKQALLLIALVACGTPSTAPSTRVSKSGPQPLDRIARVERGLAPSVQVRGEEVRYAIEDRMREHGIPAVSIAVFENYELQWAKAYGLADVEAGERADEQTIFLAGSISKSVNALGVLLAAADGTLSLDAPINEALASWKLPDNELTRAKAVTLRMLLSHTAGTTVHGFPGYAAGEPIPTVQQILDGEKPANTVPIRVDLAPGTKFRYSGGGTTITQLALAERSKRPYPEVLSERVLVPLGMKSSTFEQALPPERLKHAAAGYDGAGKVIIGKRHVYPEMAAAGLWTTPADLARFFIEVALARANRSSKISNAVALQMTTKVIANDFGAVGLGVFLSERNGAQFFGHGGADEGFRAEALVSLDGGYGLVIMANGDNGQAIFGEIEQAVFAEYGWKGDEPAIERVTLEPAQRAKFVGYYKTGRLPVAITDRDGKLELRLPLLEPVELVPVGPDRVVRRDNGQTWRIDARGQIEITRAGQPQGKPTRLPDTERHPLFELEAGRFDEAVALWREQLKTATAETVRADENFVNGVGYDQLSRNPAKGVEVLRLNATVFPESSNTHDSLGEAYMTVGDKPKAIAEYERALATLDADPRIPAERKAAHRAHAQAQLAKLRAP